LTTYYQNTNSDNAIAFKFDGRLKYKSDDSAQYFNINDSVITKSGKVYLQTVTKNHPTQSYFMYQESSPLPYHQYCYCMDSLGFRRYSDVNPLDTDGNCENGYAVNMEFQSSNIENHTSYYKVRCGEEDNSLIRQDGWWDTRRNERKPKYVMKEKKLRDFTSIGRIISTSEYDLALKFNNQEMILPLPYE